MFSKPWSGISSVVVGVKGGGGQLFFSLAKGNMRQLDWLGASSRKSFTVLSSTEVKQFVESDVTECNLLILGQLILKQGRKGIPIGGVPVCTINRVVGSLARA